jgi:hypothetical protein
VSKWLTKGQFGQFRPWVQFNPRVQILFCWVWKKIEEKKNWAQSPIAKAQDLLGPFDLYTRAFDEFNEIFFSLKLILILS